MHLKEGETYNWKQAQLGIRAAKDSLEMSRLALVASQHAVLDVVKSVGASTYVVEEGLRPNTKIL